MCKLVPSKSLVFGSNPTESWGRLREALVSRAIRWSPLRPAGAWTAALGWAGVLTVFFFLVARLGLAVLARPADLAAFCPLTGIATGILIVLGWRAFPGVVIGVVAGATAAGLMSDRGLLSPMLKGICSAGEAV